MAIDLLELGRKVRNYRDQLLLSVEQVSDGTGIGIPRLAQVEGGLVAPTGDELLILADFFKCDYRFFISNERTTPFEQTDLLFRRHGDAFSGPDRRAVQEFLYLCECEHELEQYLSKSHKKFSYRASGTYFKGHGERAADDLRHLLGYQSNAVPRDVYADFRAIGIHVFRRTLANSNISGLYVTHPVAGACVLVDYDEDIYRQRFSAAHEAGHAIFDAEGEVSVTFRKQNAKDLVELRANTFASRYLAPPSVLRAIPDVQNWDVVKARHWAQELRVSTAVLANALHGARLVAPQTAELIRSCRVDAEAKIDPELPATLAERPRNRLAELLHRGLSRAYAKLGFEAYRANQISAGRLADCLLVSYSELPMVAELFGEKLQHGI